MSDKVINAYKKNPYTWGSLPWATEEMKTTRKALDVAIDTIAGRISAEEAKAVHDRDHGMLLELRMIEFELSSLSKAVDDVWVKPEDRAMNILDNWLDIRMKMNREELTKSFHK